MTGHHEPGDAGSITGAPGPAAGAPGAPDAPPAADTAALVEALRVAVLRRMINMAAALPGGYYTEIKGQLSDGGGALVGTFKLRDFAAALKDLSAIGRGLGGPDVEDLSPIMGMVYGDGGGGDDDDEDGED